MIKAQTHSKIYIALKLQVTMGRKKPENNPVPDPIKSKEEAKQNEGLAVLGF